METKDLANFVSEMEERFKARFPDSADDLRVLLAFSGFQHAVAEMATIPRDAKLTRQRCSTCDEIVYKAQKP